MANILLFRLDRAISCLNLYKPNRIFNEDIVEVRMHARFINSRYMNDGNCVLEEIIQITQDALSKPKHSKKEKEQIVKKLRSLQEKIRSELICALKRPNPNEAFPNPNIPSLCYIKNVVKNPNIIIGDYTYYDDVDGADQFEKHVTHFYDFIGDKLIIGKFCAIAKGVEFVMNGANHRMDSATTYPFHFMGGVWGDAIAPAKDKLPLKGNTVVGHDVCIEQHVTIMPGVHIGDGAIIGANSVVASDIPPYSIAMGNPCHVVRKRFDDELIELLLQFKWWDKSIEEIEALMPILCCGDQEEVRKEIKSRL